MKILPNPLTTRLFSHTLPPSDWELYDLRWFSGPSKVLQLILKVLPIVALLIFLHLTNFKLLLVPWPEGLFPLLQSIIQLKTSSRLQSAETKTRPRVYRSKINNNQTEQNEQYRLCCCSVNYFQWCIFSACSGVSSCPTLDYMGPFSNNFAK